MHSYGPEYSNKKDFAIPLILSIIFSKNQMQIFGYYLHKKNIVRIVNFKISENSKIKLSGLELRLAEAVRH